MARLVARDVKKVFPPTRQGQDPVFALRNLPIDQFPDVEIPVVAITTVYPGASPETIEREVSERLEQAFNPVKGVDKITSISLESVSQIIVEFDLDLGARVGHLHDLAFGAERGLEDRPDGGDDHVDADEVDAGAEGRVLIVADQCHVAAKRRLRHHEGEDNETGDGNPGDERNGPPAADQPGGSAGESSTRGDSGAFTGLRVPAGSGGHRVPPVVTTSDPRTSPS